MPLLPLQIRTCGCVFRYTLAMCSCKSNLKINLIHALLDWLLELITELLLFIPVNFYTCVSVILPTQMYGRFLSFLVPGHCPKVRIFLKGTGRGVRVPLLLLYSGRGLGPLLPSLMVLRTAHSSAT